MIYKLIGNNNYLVNPIHTILKNRGIDDINAFLSISEKNVNDWRLLSNIEKAVETLLKHIGDESMIWVQVDP
jgi:single-stranded-DNA-specific exonuclease